MTKTSTKRPKDKIPPLRVILKQLPDRLARAHLSLPQKRKDALVIAIKQIHADFRHAERSSRRQPNAQRIVATRRSLASAVERLEHALQRDRKLGTHRLPDATLMMIGRSVSDNILTEVSGRVPRQPILQGDAEHSIRTFTTEERQSIGLTHGPELLLRVLQNAHAPLVEWLEEDRRDQGGRPKDAYRTHVIHQLVNESKAILGASPLERKSTRFNLLCECVNDLFGLPQSNYKTFRRRTLASLIAKSQKEPLAQEDSSPVLTKGHRI